MPVLVNPKTCLDREHCFAAAACPYGAFYHNSLKRTWEVDATICGDCPGPCLNFCDQDALRWGDDLVDLKLVKAALEGTMTAEQVAEARLKHKKELEAAQKKSAEGVIALTRANFEREVLKSGRHCTRWGDLASLISLNAPAVMRLALRKAYTPRGIPF